MRETFPEIPFFVPVLFGLLTLGLAFASAWIFRAREYRAIQGGIFFWIALVSGASYFGFYEDFEARPPHLLYLIAPPLIFLFYLCISKKMKPLIDRTSLRYLTFIQSFRIVMEVILWLLVAYKAISPIMTFTGHNLDILVGLSAPLIGYVYS